MTPTALTLAIDRYDRHTPFFDGSLNLDEDLAVAPLQVGEATLLRDGKHRHARMLKRCEFDAAEVSLSSYVMAKARGMSFTAIPVFPRRLFSQTQIYVNPRSGVRSPADLAGRRVGLQSFQTTLAVLAKGDLGHEYGVDTRAIRWNAKRQETIEFAPPAGYSIDYLDADADLGSLLAAGEIDALFHSRVLEGHGGAVRRLFPDPQAETLRYFRSNGFFPVMHLVALRSEVAASHPEFPQVLMRLFERAKAVSRSYFDDPGWSQLPWGRLAFEDQREAAAADPWPIGLSANRAYLERFISYSFDQGLIDRELGVEELFHSSTLAT